MTEGVTLRVRVGRGDCVPGAHAAMALRLVDWAKARGYRASVAASRRAESAARYVTIAIGGNEWRIRVAGHLHSRSTGHDRPHFDLVTRDGVTGEEHALRFLHRIVSGEQAWFDPGRSPCPRSRRRGAQRPKNGGRR